MATVNKKLKGLRNIHFAPLKNGEYQTPIKIEFSKTLEANLSYEGEADWADDVIIDNSYNFNGGEGKLTLVGLNKEEYEAMFGSKKVKGGTFVSSQDVAPTGAYIFERGKKGSSAKRLYVIYACTNAPSGINAEGIADGKAPTSIEEISFSISESATNGVFFFIDTDDPTVDQTQITKWFTEVQEPIDLEV